MTELKTLEDIERFRSEEYKAVERELKRDIRIEAMKWIQTDCTIDHRHWICKFFNITEEDLK